MLNVDKIEVYIVYLKIIEFCMMRVANAINVNELPIQVLYVQEVVTRPKILNRTILCNWIHVAENILLCKRIIFKLKYRIS